MRRAGLDYHEYAQVLRHASWPAFLASQQPPADRLFALTTQRRRQHVRRALFARRLAGVRLGNQGSGARSARNRLRLAQRLKVPMLPGQRSLNLSNTVAVTVFEAWRQNGFGGAALPA